METWTLVFTDWDPAEGRFRETLNTLGNGYFATRGAPEEVSAGEDHYPGTYLSGGYNRLTSLVGGVEVENEDLVNWPNWLCLSFRHPGGHWFDLRDVEILSYQKELDLRCGQLSRVVRFRDSSGKESKLECLRFVSMDNSHVGALQWTLESVNWSSSIEIKSWIDGSVENKGVKRYGALKSRHLVTRNKIFDEDGTFSLETYSNSSYISVTQSIRTDCYLNNSRLSFPLSHWEEADSLGVTFFAELEVGAKLRIEKLMCFFTSRDHASFHPTYESRRLLKNMGAFKELLNSHRLQWERLWRLCDVELPGRIRETRLLRLHIFHLLQTVSLKTIDLDVGVPARGLHGEAYRGHIFWDELFILPFLNLRIPELSRSLLIYRFRRLGEARLNAQSKGFQGALFPWQSGSNGEEECQLLHLNPISKHWLVDATHLQRHINGAILHNIWQYYTATEDTEFLSQFGVEMALELSRFWVSAMSFDPLKQRYVILKVVGPDEFHTNYPGQLVPGIDNNAYTNYLASWSIKTSFELFQTLAEDRQNEVLLSLSLTRADLLSWLEKARRVYIPMERDGIIQQFEGFSELKDLDWEAYRKKYGNIERIDRILEAEGDSVNDYKVNKQSDVLMLFYLFGLEELRTMFEWLGYSFDPSWIHKNIDYHLALSTNGSSLSRIVHTWVISKYERGDSWKWFSAALETDVADIQGGTTSEGIHLGAMSGTVDLVQRCYLGIEVRQDVLWINPKLPPELRNLSLMIHFRGHSIKLLVVERSLQVMVSKSRTYRAKLGIMGEVHELKEGASFSVGLQGAGISSPKVEPWPTELLM